MAQGGWMTEPILEKESDYRDYLPGHRKRTSGDTNVRRKTQNRTIMVTMLFVHLAVHSPIPHADHIRSQGPSRSGL